MSDCESYFQVKKKHSESAVAKLHRSFFVLAAAENYVRLHQTTKSYIMESIPREQSGLKNVDLAECL